MTTGRINQVAILRRTNGPETGTEALRIDQSQGRGVCTRPMRSASACMEQPEAETERDMHETVRKNHRGQRAPNAASPRATHNDAEAEQQRAHLGAETAARPSSQKQHGYKTICIDTSPTKMWPRRSNESTCPPNAP